MAEDLVNSMEYIRADSTDKSKPDTVIYAQGGKKYSVDKFDDAWKEYQEKGTTPAGFDALKPGSLSATIRRGFEAGNAPLQQAAQAGDTSIANLINRGQAYPSVGSVDFGGARSSEEALGKIWSALKSIGVGVGTNYVQQLTQPGGVPGQPVDPQASGPLHNVTSSIDTPGKLVGQGALALSGMRPIGKLLQQTSGIIPTAVRAGGAALAEYGGDKAGGIGATESPDTPFMQKSYVRPLMTAVNIAVQEGIFGLYNKMTGHSLSEKAAQQVNSDVLKQVKKDFPAVNINNPAEFEDVLGTPRGLDIFIQKGVKGFKTEADNGARQFVDDINDALQAPLGKVARRHIDSISDEYREAVNTLLTNIDKPAIVAKQRDLIDDISTRLTNEVGKEVNRLSPSLSPDLRTRQLERLHATFTEYQKREMAFQSGAEVLAALKNSNPGGGVDVTKFQQYVATRMHGGSDLLERVGVAAGRGQAGGVDRHYNVPSNILPAWIRNPKAKGTGIPLASHYTGTVRGLTNPVGFEMGLKAAVDRFMSSDRETQ